jgi:hypothetical protein
MQTRSLIWAALTIGLAWSLWQKWTLRPVHPRDGQIASEEPRQTDARSVEPIHRGRWTLTPRADYDITARVLGRESYRFDPLSSLIPEDLALGWGPMSDNRVLAGFDITQSARFYTWRPRGAMPIPRDEVIVHSANTHVIPADGLVEKQLARVRVGQVVHLTGELVDGSRDDGAWIRTSLTRSDSGAGACEVMLVESVQVE